ncbi:MAG: hypothetical protein AAF737_04270 [Pseudomonadota bacterium]
MTFKFPMRASISILMASVCLGGSASAQDVAQPTQQMPKPLVASGPDMSALRYYVQRGEMQNYQRELQRLRIFHPGWQAPTSPDAVLQSSDENDLWALYSNDDLDGITQAMRDRMARQPGWAPSAELRQKVADKAARLRIIAADNADQWSDVLSLSRTLTSGALNSDVDLRWRVARAEALTGQSSKAVDSYSAILADFSEPSLQSATLGKALDVLSVDPTSAVLSRPDVAVDKAVRQHFETEIVRRRLAVAATGALAPKLTQSRLEAFEKALLLETPGQGGDKSADDAALLGWYHTAKSDPQAARKWFSEAQKRGKTDLKTTEGLVLALVSLDPDAELSGGGNPRSQALSLVRPLWDKNDDLGHRFIDLVSDDLYSEPPRVIEADLLQSVSAATSNLRSPVGAEALAWYAYNVRQYDTAYVWFQKANGWKKTESRLFGEILTLLELGHSAQADALAAQHRAEYPRLVEALQEYRAGGRSAAQGKATAKAGLRKAASARTRINPIVAAHKRGDYATCLRLINKLSNPSADVLQMKGWCLMLAKRPSEAALAFERSQALKGGKNRRDSAYGVALAALRSGHTEQALVAARNEGLTTQQRRTISVEALTQRARVAFNRRDYAASLYALNLRQRIAQEPRDLSMLRGWSHYHLGRKSAARSIFASLDQHLSTRDTRRALSQLR